MSIKYTIAKFFCVIHQTSYGFAMVGHHPTSEAAWKHSQSINAELKASPYPVHADTYVSCFSELPPKRMVCRT